jgi:protein associated with RNAse G/E
MDERKNGNRFFKWVTVQAYKHDGLLHRQWSPAYLTAENDDYWALSSKASLVTENDGRRWMTKEHAVFILFKHEWMNVICMMKENGGICYYVNVASRRFSIMVSSNTSITISTSNSSPMRRSKSSMSRNLSATF